MKRLHATLLVLLGAVALAAGTVYLFSDKPMPGGPILSGKAQVTRIAPAGFGQLTSLAPAQKENATAGSSSSRPEMMNSAAPTSAATDAMTVGDSATSGIAMPYPIWYGPHYVYKGEAFTQGEAKLDVLKRVPMAASADQAVSVLQQLHLQLIDPGSFGNASLDQLTLSQDQDFGYTVTFDLRNGMISIYQNWQKWPQYGCKPDGSCDQPQPLTASDMPADDAIVAIADGFLKDHGIPTDAYGKPAVQDQWRNYLLAAPASDDKAMAVRPMPIYYPESVSVVYQQLLNGKPVYEQGGAPSGLTVTVDLRNRKVSNLYGLSTQNYQSSSYDAITDVQKIIQIAEQGGQYGVINYGGVMLDTKAPVMENSIAPAPPTKSMPPTEIMPIQRPPEQPPEADLGTPAMGYVKMYDYRNGSGAELYVPALVFPITNRKVNDYQQYVTVPLIADLLQNPYPVPMMKASGAVSGSAGSGTAAEGVAVPTPAVMPKK